ncbi:MAG: VCBS repeat-containing protein [Candidatus Midichloria mitochondrii]|nr:VCBS repeat-containing protein [Candidatus Midichloria mitochondrii]MDJ1288172.1 VCBS repeat-containing protein [Candidatus Midichloria mitochondrii]MDJ1299056.1 VCBS repeat-containing protein [Candidatus Midichloria mitochondrii]MDJ1313226.1 VCBS repeat-containing protein [Candidatus Midichloria mitochondrii]
MFAPAVDYVVGGSPNTLTEADFNRDGKLDVVSPSCNTSSVSILLGKGDGTFQAATLYGIGKGNPWQVAVGDFSIGMVRQIL